MFANKDDLETYQHFAILPNDKQSASMSFAGERGAVAKSAQRRGRFLMVVISSIGLHHPWENLSRVDRQQAPFELQLAAFSSFSRFFYMNKMKFLSTNLMKSIHISSYSIIYLYIYMNIISLLILETTETLHPDATKILELTSLKSGPDFRDPGTPPSRSGKTGSAVRLPEADDR